MKNGSFIVDFRTFHIFGFMDDFAIPTACQGNSMTRSQDYTHDIHVLSIQDICIVTAYRHRLFICLLALLAQ